MNEFLVFGLVGGAIPDLLRLINNRYQLQIPAYLKSVNFYMGFFFLLILGMVTVQLLDAKSITEALSYGYAAPQIISGLLGNLAKTPKNLKTRRDIGPAENKLGKMDLFEFWKY
ncbi:MAG: hypothetical protein ACKOZZ_01025 [Bacteroidota bacterium]